MIGIIAAVTSNGIIGIDGKLPFNYKEDLDHFRKTTTNSVVVMGRKTFQSIGKPLPNRINICISSSNFYESENLILVKSFSEALEEAKIYNKNIWIIGGSSVYEEAMNVADKIILTITPDIINNNYAIKFPWINPLNFIASDHNKLSGNSNLTTVTYLRNPHICS